MLSLSLALEFLFAHRAQRKALGACIGPFLCIAALPLANEKAKRPEFEEASDRAQFFEFDSRLKYGGSLSSPSSTPHYAHLVANSEVGCSRTRSQPCRCDASLSLLAARNAAFRSVRRASSSRPPHLANNKNQARHPRPSFSSCSPDHWRGMQVPRPLHRRIVHLINFPTFTECVRPIPNSRDFACLSSLHSFNLTMDPSLDLPNLATCTTCRFKENKSNYWTAVMYFKHTNGSYIRVSNLALLSFVIRC